MIFDKIQKHYIQNKPFVVYRKSNETQISGFFQIDDVLYTTKNYNESGFVLAPFDTNETSILIPSEKSDFVSKALNFKADLSSKKIISEEPNIKFHTDLVSKGIKAINEKHFKKVVLSRKETTLVTDFEIVTIYKRLLEKYPTAFVYVWHHPKVGLWLGATPETLVKTNDKTFETMSLAGTQVFRGTKDVSWKKKEIEEQQFVTDYIIKKLESVCNLVNQHPLKTIQAGNLLHLQSRISGALNGSSISELIKKLHPTPAVCGLPKNASKRFILENEGYNREYYTGFLGELNISEGKKTKKSELFVNLRCMKITRNTSQIYVGGGITKDSNPIKEFEETVNKAKVMKSVL